MHRSYENANSSNCFFDNENSNENKVIPNEATKVKSLAVVSKSSSRLGSSSVYLDIVPLLDSGSDKFFCERRLVEQFDLDGSPIKLVVQTMMPGTPHVMNTKIVSFNLRSLNTNIA